MGAVLVFLLGFLTLHYAVVMLRFAQGFAHVTSAPPLFSEDTPFVSVLIPARNEAKVLENGLTSIFANTYPADLYEVIVIDDHSEDDTADVVRHCMGRYNQSEQERLRLLELKAAGPIHAAYKKQAIDMAVREARGTLILTTDADCTVGPRWIETMTRPFIPRISFVSGPVLYRIQNHLSDPMQALEFLGLVAVGAGAIGIGRPNMCNGANVAYRKSTFLALGGFSGIDHVASGDDELLMQKIHTAQPGTVYFCANHDAVVHTDPVRSFRGFFEQRRRWASKGGHYPNRWLVAMIAGIYLFYALLLAMTVLAFWYPNLWPWIGLSILIKILAEWPLMWRACRFFRRLWLMLYFIPEQLLQIPYVVVVGLAGSLGRFTWKGRTISR